MIKRNKRKSKQYNPTTCYLKTERNAHTSYPRHAYSTYPRGTEILALFQCWFVDLVPHRPDVENSGPNTNVTDQPAPHNIADTERDERECMFSNP